MCSLGLTNISGRCGRTTVWPSFKVILWFSSNATDNGENPGEVRRSLEQPRSGSSAGWTLVMPVWRNPGCIRRSGSPLWASVPRRAEIRDSGPTRMTRGKPSWLGFNPPTYALEPPSIAPNSCTNRFSNSFQPVSSSLGFSLLRATRNVGDSRRSSSSLSLSLSLFLFRFVCGGIGGVVERKAEIDFHGRAPRSRFLIGNCVPAIDKTAECESWKYVERSFRGFARACVCVYGEDTWEGESSKSEEGGKSVGGADFSKKNVYRREMKSVFYIYSEQENRICLRF